MPTQKAHHEVGSLFQAFNEALFSRIFTIEVSDASIGTI